MNSKSGFRARKISEKQFSSQGKAIKLSSCYDLVASQARRKDNELKLIEKDFDKRRKVSYSHISSAQRLVERDLCQLRLAQERHMEERYMRENSAKTLEDVMRNVTRENQACKKEENDKKWKFLLWGVKPQRKTSHVFLPETVDQAQDQGSDGSCNNSSCSSISSNSPRCSAHCQRLPKIQMNSYTSIKRNTDKNRCGRLSVPDNIL